MLQNCFTVVSIINFRFGFVWLVQNWGTHWNGNEKHGICGWRRKAINGRWIEIRSQSSLGNVVTISFHVIKTLGEECISKTRWVLNQCLQFIHFHDIFTFLFFILKDFSATNWVSFMDFFETISCSSIYKYFFITRRRGWEIAAWNALEQCLGIMWVCVP